MEAATAESPHARGGRARWIAVAATLVLIVGWDFAAATEFIGDDHLFLAFARHAHHPFEAFVSDRHGGEYYRPVPMMLWWLLGRAGHGATWPFALLGFGLHVTVAALVRAFARRCGASPMTADLAGALFLVAPAEREAALWFAASTDLLATVGTVGALLCLARGTNASFGASLLLAGLAYLSKESAIVLPLLAGALLLFPPPITARVGFRAAVHAALAVVYLVVRFAVLRGWGGAGDPGPSFWGRGLQLVSGLVHGLIGYQVLAPGIAWLLGGAALVGALATLPRERRDSDVRVWWPLVWIGVTVAPLFAVGWVVGSRYFYLPTVGLAVLVARALRRRETVAGILTIGFLLALGTVAATGRRAELREYRARLAAAKEAVTAGVARGQRLFHVRCGIKDLDLVLKSDPDLAGQADELLVLSDVPASFVLMPPRLVERTRFLRASPPLPPAGAYRFGGREIVGLARREESPDLEQVITRLPDLHFLALVRTGAAFSWRDVTHTTD